MAEFQPSKLAMRVRFPSPAPVVRACFRRSDRLLDASHRAQAQPSIGVVSRPLAAWVRPGGGASRRHGAGPLVRSPRQTPHDLDGPLEVLNAGRGSWERRPHAAERRYGLRAERPRIGSGPWCGFTWSDGRSDPAPLLPEFHDLHVGLRGARCPRPHPDSDRSPIGGGVVLGDAFDDAGCA